MTRLKLFGGIVLNDASADDGASAGPADASAGERLQRVMLAALARHTDGAGRVDYARLRASADFGAVDTAARRLHAVDLTALAAREARLAFWINVYNALVLHAIVALSIRRSVTQVWNFFGRVAYRVGGFRFTADDIEHGVLRGNRRRLLPPLRPFGAHDPRLRFAVDPVDPRIHFAITCGAASCPPVGAYTAAAVDIQLDLAARNFVNQDVRAGHGGAIVCSKVFKWYGRDFETAGGLAAFLLRYLDDGPVKDALARGAAPCRAYRPYSWKLQYPAAE
ncbi:MAG: DUF547 domain-containing protein [Candidatus Rokuibacteriota bacterium]